MKAKSYTFINSFDHNKSLSNIPEEYYIDNTDLLVTMMIQDHIILVEIFMDFLLRKKYQIMNVNHYIQQILYQEIVDVLYL